MEHTHASRTVQWSLIIGIVIVLNLFFNYAISLVYKAPDYNMYFPQSQVVTNSTTEKDCVAAGGQWNNQVVPKSSDGTVQPQGYCNPDFTKQQEFQTAQKDYDRTVFILLVLLGVASLISGAIFENIVLSSAFSWGGVLSLLIASMRYWSDANNIVKVVILAIALGGLIWVAVKKFA